jgi:uncharacterized membrane protein
MITDALVHLVSLFVSGLFHLLPNIPVGWLAPLSAAIVAFDSAYGALIQPWNYYVPLKLIFTLVTIGFAMEVAMQIWSAVRFVIGVLRGADHG